MKFSSSVAVILLSASTISHAGWFDDIVKTVKEEAEKVGNEIRKVVESEGPKVTDFVKKHAERFAEVVNAVAEQDWPKVIGNTPLKYYGHYCGPNYGDPTYSKEPIDAIDGACRRHDMCYGRESHGTHQLCHCDGKMVDEVTQALDGHNIDHAGRAAGVTMAVFFASPILGCYCERTGRFLTNPSMEDKRSCARN